MVRTSDSEGGGSPFLARVTLWSRMSHRHRARDQIVLDRFGCAPVMVWVGLGRVRDGSGRGAPGGEVEKDVMTLKEVAAYLKLGEKSVQGMAERGEMPAANVDGQWRFMKLLIDDWLACSTVMPPEKKPSAPADAEGAAEEEDRSLSAMFDPEVMNLSVRPGSKREVLAQLVEPLQRSGRLPEPGPFLNSLVNRERLGSTAASPGAAIPHPRTPAKGLFAKPAVALGLCREGTDFGASDKKPVHVFFVICASEETTHLRLMAQLSGLLRRPGIVERLCACGDGAGVIETIREAEGGGE